VGLRWRSLIPGLLSTLAGVTTMMAAEGSGSDVQIHGWIFWRGALDGLLAMVFWVAFAIINSACA